MAQARAVTPEMKSFVAAITPLLAASDAPPSVEAVTTALAVTLHLERGNGQDGLTYAGQSSFGWPVEFFSRQNSHKFNVSVDFRSAGAKDPASLSSFEQRLTETGWIEVNSIDHPFRSIAFAKDSRRIRVEHDGVRLLSFEMFN
jgi:hypothetical protein